MKKVIFGILTLSILAFTGCEDPAANKTKAVVNNTNAAAPANTAGNQTANAATAPAKVAKGEAIMIDPAASKVEFTGSKVTGKHDGGFKQFAGMIDLVNNKAEESSVSVDIDMKSVFSDADGLTKHLQTGDFFEVEKFPKSSFKSTKIAADSAKGADSFSITGDLTMRGVTKSISFPAKIAVKPEEVSVEAEFSINRKDFGIVYAGKADDLIRDDVVIKLNLRNARKK